MIREGNAVGRNCRLSPTSIDNHFMPDLPALNVFCPVNRLVSRLISRNWFVPGMIANRDGANDAVKTRRTRVFSGTGIPARIQFRYSLRYRSVSIALRKIFIWFDSVARCLRLLRRPRESKATFPRRINCRWFRLIPPLFNTLAIRLERINFPFFFFYIFSKRMLFFENVYVKRFVSIRLVIDV